jgi:cyclopropane-fatty-acyl-phospholipid synthase
MTRLMTRQGATIARTIDALMTCQLGVELPVRIRAWDGSEAGPPGGPQDGSPGGSPGGPVLVIRSPLALRRMLWRPGELGLARAYVSGDLSVEGDLTQGLHLLKQAIKRARPRPALVPALARAAIRLNAIGPPPPAPATEIRVSGRRHSRARDRAVIAGHYDVPPAFYQLILDPQLAYSCAYWVKEGAGYTLEDAQRDKLDRVCGKLGLEPGARLLDMGCGWGSLTMHAAARYQARVTAVTLSAQQGAYVRDRARELGLDHLVEVRIQHYRDVSQCRYDAIASIEMGEHVGAARYPAFSAALYGLLRPGGRLLIQQMSRGSRAPGGGPFIESYIAVDMHMRPVGETVGLLAGAGFEVLGVQAMRCHYVRTIRAWLDNFEANLPAVRAILGDEAVRVWRLYLAGGALAFEEGRMGVDQILATRSQ